MKSTFKEMILTPDLEANPNFFTKFQQLDLTVNVLGMYSELDEILHKEDEFIVEWDEKAQEHLMLHKSKVFEETRPICYLSSDRYDYKTHIPFIIECLKEVWVEYEI